MFTIRPFDYSDADYNATVALWNAAHPDHPSSAQFQENNPMLQINLRLGFQPRPATLVYFKELN